MLDPKSILFLFENVLTGSVTRDGINRLDIRRGVQNMAHIYAPRPSSLTMNSVDVANFNDVAHRCAYLHKYAALHTAMVQDIMFLILEEHWMLFKTMAASENFRICSLGGGPGSDVIGVIAALNTLFNVFKVQVTVVDLMEEWKSTFSSIIDEITYGNYGMLRTSVAENLLKWNYVGANLLDKMTDPVLTAIDQASLITLVKFVSAAACQDTEKMIKRIFRKMKPGALLLFIDNDGGGFHELIRKAAKKYGCITVFGPLRHYNYCNEYFKVERFGYTSCFATTVTAHLLKKPLNEQCTNFYGNLSRDVTLTAQPNDNNTDTPHSKLSVSNNNLALLQNAYAPGCINNSSNSVYSYQENANISNNTVRTVKPASDKKLNSHSSLPTSHKNPKTLQSTTLPTSYKDNNIPVSSYQQRGTNISSAVTSRGKVVKGKEINPVSNLPTSNKNTTILESTNLPASSNNDNIPVSSIQQCNTITAYDAVCSVKRDKWKVINSHSDQCTYNKSPKILQSTNLPVISKDNIAPVSSNQQYSTNISHDVKHTAKPSKDKRSDPLSNLSISHKNPNILESSNLPTGSNDNSIPVSSNQQCDINIQSDVSRGANSAKDKKINSNSHLSTSHKNPTVLQSTNFPTNRNGDNIPVSSNQQYTGSIPRDVIHSAKLDEDKKIKPHSNPTVSQNEARFYESSNLPIRINDDYIPFSSDKEVNTNISHNDIFAQSSTKADRKFIIDPRTISSISRSPHTPDVPVCINQPSASQKIIKPNKSAKNSKDNHVKSNNLSATNQNSCNNAAKTQSSRLSEPSNRSHYAAIPINSNSRSSYESPQPHSNAASELEDNSETCCSCCAVS